MKIFLFLFLFNLLFIACTKDEAKLETFSAEAFAYDLEDGWEVNASIYVKGFEYEKNSQSDTYTASISYNVDLQTPDGKKIENIFSDVLNKNSNEKFMDLRLEAQFELDSTYQVGKYELLFHIRDNLSKKTIKSPVNFNLEK